MRRTSVFTAGENLGGGAALPLRTFKFRRVQAASGSRNPKQKDILSDVLLFWRRERDSNPRTGISRYTISNRAPSTSSAISPNGCCPWSLVTAKIIIPDFFPPSSFFSKKFRFFCRPGNGPLREAVSAAPFCQIARKRGLLFPLIFHGEN